MNFKYKSDQTVGDYLIISREILIHNKKKYPAYLCKCVCGKEEIIRQTYIKPSVICAHVLNFDVGWSSFYNSYMSSSDRRGKFFNLSINQFKMLCQKRCFYCGNLPVYRSAHNIYANGIDRINNNDGYKLQNCVACCPDCNKLKGTFRKQDFINICKKIALHQDNKEHFQDISEFEKRPQVIIKKKA